MKPDIRDYFVFGGIGLAVLGVMLIHFPAALILLGGALFFIGVRA
jgi:hypothetical protein